VQHTITHCNTLRLTATRGRRLARGQSGSQTAWRKYDRSYHTHDCNTLQHSATLCNTLQRTAAHCNTSAWREERVGRRQGRRHTIDCGTHMNSCCVLDTQGEKRVQDTAAHDKTVQHTATHCNSLQLTATHCNTLQHVADSRREGRVQHTTAHDRTLQHTAAQCNPLQHSNTGQTLRARGECNTLLHTFTRCNTLQHTATHCNTLQHTATQCSSLQLTPARSRHSARGESATHCCTRQNTATHCNTLRLTATYPADTRHEGGRVGRRRNGGRIDPAVVRLRARVQGFCTLQHTATHCNALQLKVTHCNT